MAICYVKAYFDWIEQTAALSDAERGRLFIAILEYARSGLEPKLDGRESILFPVFKAQLDRDKISADASAENGKKGGRPKTKSNLDKPNLTCNNLAKGNKEKEEEKENNNEGMKNTSSKEKVKKETFGNEFGNVKLTMEEYQKLCTDFGIDLTLEAIDYLDAYIKEKNYKSKEHYLAMRRWVIDAVKEKRQKSLPAVSGYHKKESKQDFYDRLDAWAKS